MFFLLKIYLHEFEMWLFFVLNKVIHLHTLPNCFTVKNLGAIYLLKQPGWV